MSDLKSQAYADGVCILTAEGEKRWTWIEFVQELKREASEGLVSILTSDTATSIAKGRSLIVLREQKEAIFWETMDTHGWPSGQHPQVVRRKTRQ